MSDVSAHDESKTYSAMCDKIVKLTKENDLLRTWLGRIGTSSGYDADMLQQMARAANNGDDPYTTMPSKESVQA